jgi:hypothetical protein
METQTWMKGLNPDLRLVDTYIPASHDSGAYGPGGLGITGWELGAVTQSGDFFHQAVDGIRYFDVRCERYDGEIVIHHGPVMGARFDDVMSQLAAFSAASPSEILFLDIDIQDECEEEIIAIILAHVAEQQLATEHLDADGIFVSDVTWGALWANGRRFVVTWSSRKHTAQSTVTLNWQAKPDVQSQRLFGDWSVCPSPGRTAPVTGGGHAPPQCCTPSITTLNSTLFLCLLDNEGSIYVATSSGGVQDWQSKDQVAAQRLFGDWSGVASVPTLAAFSPAPGAPQSLFMCVMDSGGGIYVARSADGLNWQSKDEVQGQKLFDDWSGVATTPTLAAFPPAPGAPEALFMCLMDNAGAIYMAKSADGLNWQSKDQVQGQRLFGGWSGVAATPTMAAFKGTLFMCLLDSRGRIYVASSGDGLQWQLVQDGPLFGDWAGVTSTPTLVALGDSLYMCLLDHDQNIYVTWSNDGQTWETDKARVEASRQFGDWSGVHTTPAMTALDDAIYMCLLDVSGGVYAADSSGGFPSRIAWLSLNEKVRWSPYDDFDTASVDEILEMLDGYARQWTKDCLFVAQVIDTPYKSPLTSTPAELEAANKDALNGWVMNHGPTSNLNVIMRDFVNNYPDVIAHIVNLNQLFPPS